MGPLIINGRYEVIAELGRGGMGIVYKAKQCSLNRVVAIKMLSRELAGDSEFRRRFQQEAEVIARLQHDNIIAVYDIEPDRGTFFIIMEFVQGISLQQLVRQEERLEPQRAAQLVTQVARALGYAHGKGIIHRDIKPDNIMVVADGQKAKVMDFGIARVADSSLKTQTGISMGTPKYMSPEQAKGQRVDHRSDLYSLGVVLYACVTGELPFEGDSPFTVALKHMQEPPPRPTEKVKGLPLALEKVILRAMAKDPDDRFQSGEEFAAALEAAVAPPSPPPQPLPSREPEEPALQVAGVAVGASQPGRAGEDSPLLVSSGYPLGTSGDTGRLSIPASAAPGAGAARGPVRSARLAWVLVPIAAVAAILIWVVQPSSFDGGSGRGTGGVISVPTPSPPLTPTATVGPTPGLAKSAPSSPKPAGWRLPPWGQTFSPGIDKALDDLGRIKGRVDQIVSQGARASLTQQAVDEMAGLLSQALDHAGEETERAAAAEWIALAQDLRALNAKLEALPDKGRDRVLERFYELRPDHKATFLRMLESEDRPLGLRKSAPSLRRGTPSPPRP